MNGLKKRIAGRIVAVTIAAATLSMGVGVVSAQAIVTTSTTGYPGTRGATGSAMCASLAPWIGGNVVSTGWSDIHPSSPYSNYRQYISSMNRLEKWNGTSWAFYATKSGGGDYVPAGGSGIRFSGYTWNNLPVGIYRSSIAYSWYVGSTRVGTATNYYEGSDYSNASFGYATVGPTTPGVISWCEVDGHP